VIDCRANFSYIRIISFIRVEDRTCGGNLKFRYERKDAIFELVILGKCI